MGVSTLILVLLPAGLMGFYIARASTGKGWTFAWKRLVISVAVVEIIAATILFTYGYYIGSPLELLFWSTLALFIGVVIDLAFVQRYLLLIRGLGAFVAFSALLFYVIAPAIMPVGPDLVGFLIWLAILLPVAGVVTALSARSGIRERFRRALPWARPARFFALLVALGLIAGPLVSFIALPAGASQAPVPSALSASQVDGPPDFFVTNTSHIRVVSWDLATQYIRRAYTNFASALEDDLDLLFQYTHPTMVRGDFVWVNAPTYESLKWIGNPQVPFFVLLKNLPENMTLQEPRVVETVELPLDYHEMRIGWEKRIIHQVNDQFSGQLYVYQVRFSADDALRPYWILYLAESMNFQAMGVLRVVVLVDAQTGAFQAFSVDDPAIPSWLEVVYPDEYIYEWTTWWAAQRFGLSYGVVNKLHLYEPDDEAARFVVVEDTAYWQIPLVQQASRVLGGVVNVNTRTGETFFFNLEGRSTVDLDTVIGQVGTYLASGAIGFQLLRIDEAYLYPFRMVDGRVRYAYVVPLYAGFTVQKYAIVDAEEYTAAPVIESNLRRAVDAYRAKNFGQPVDLQAEWQNHTIENAFLGAAPGGAGVEAVVTLNGTTYIVTENQLGVATGDAQGAWRTLELAITAWTRGDAVVIAVVILEGAIVDVYWTGSTLIPPPWGT